MPDSKNCKWFLDHISPEEGHMHGIKQTLYSKKTKFQHMEIMLTGSYGKCLVLDGKMQSSEVDEFIYHEVLVHPAVLTHPDPKSVFVVGGGEGATLREILRHKTVERAVMVDIDEEVVMASKELLPDYHAGAFDDPRTELKFLDARRYLEETDEKFDCIIIDISEPVVEGPAYMLYTREFYRMVNERLTDEGTIALQSGTTSVTNLLNLTCVHKTLAEVFPVVVSMQAAIPSFGLPWGFTLASKKNDPRTFGVTEVDKRISERVEGDLRYYDGEAHQMCMHLPKFIRKAIDAQDRIIEDNAPLFTYNL
jgi:spermidine synthase